MINRLYIIPFVFFLLAFSCHHIDDEYKKIDAIKIVFVNREISTPFSIDCQMFDTLFKDSYKTLVIDNSKDVERIKRSLGNLKKISDTINVNTRVKVYLYANSELEFILCYDAFENIYFDGKGYFKNDKLVDFINKKLTD